MLYRVLPLDEGQDAGWVRHAGRCYLRSAMGVLRLPERTGDIVRIGVMAEWDCDLRIPATAVYVGRYRGTRTDSVWKFSREEHG